jgi:hypothetical protein
LKVESWSFNDLLKVESWKLKVESWKFDLLKVEEVCWKLTSSCIEIEEMAGATDVDTCTSEFVFDLFCHVNETVLRPDALFSRIAPSCCEKQHFHSQLVPSRELTLWCLLLGAINYDRNWCSTLVFAAAAIETQVKWRIFIASAIPKPLWTANTGCKLRQAVRLHHVDLHLHLPADLHHVDLHLQFEHSSIVLASGFVESVKIAHAKKSRQFWKRRSSRLR